MTKAVIFDMDGVLVDNRDMHMKSFHQWCITRNIDVDVERLKDYFGMGNRDIFPAILGRNLSDEECRQFSEEKEAIYRQMFSEVIEPTPGLTDFLSFLKSHDIICAVGSSGMRKNVDMVLSKCNISEYFDVIVDGDQLSKAKPDPEVYNKCATKLNISPDKCIVCEDSLAGIQSARGAGMKVIALATTLSRSEHHDYDILIDNFKDLDFNAVINLCI